MLARQRAQRTLSPSAFFEQCGWAKGKEPTARSNANDQGNRYLRPLPNGRRSDVTKYEFIPPVLDLDHEYEDSLADISMIMIYHARVDIYYEIQILCRYWCSGSIGWTKLRRKQDCINGIR